MKPALSFDSRRRGMESLRSATFDVLILGGGINGAGLARDLALRARHRGELLRVGLVEQRHFASGTSGRNSQLIHGGLRYLKQLEFGLVREALRERATLLRIAPHLVEPLPFLIPFYGWFARAFYGAGLFLYDTLAGSRNVGRRRYLPAAEVARTEPGLARDGLMAAAIYFDCRVHSTRFVLENIFDAAREGVTAANYVRAEEHTRADSGFRVRLADALSGETFEARARKLVDATGPWARGEALRLVRGSHLVLPRLNAGDNAIAYFAADGRIIFVIPWGGRHDLSLVGTTDHDHAAGPDDVRISPEEVGYLMGIVRSLFPSAGHVQPIAAFSSLRPLLRSASDSPTRTSREHRIWNSPDGVLHMAGGKYTTYRTMCEEAAEAVLGEIAPRLAGLCHTAETPLGGNTPERLEALRASIPDTAAKHGLEPAEVELLVHDYGVQAPNVLSCLPESPPEGLSRLEAAVVDYSVDHEMVQRLPDLLFVSTHWGYERPFTAEGLLPYARAVGRRLAWDGDRIEEETRLALRLSALPD